MASRLLETGNSLIEMARETHNAHIALSAIQYLVMHGDKGKALAAIDAAHQESFASHQEKLSEGIEKQLKPVFSRHFNAIRQVLLKLRKHETIKEILTAILENRDSISADAALHNNVEKLSREPETDRQILEAAKYLNGPAWFAVASKDPGKLSEIDAEIKSSLLQRGLTKTEITMIAILLPSANPFNLANFVHAASLDKSEPSAAPKGRRWLPKFFLPKRRRE